MTFKPPSTTAPYADRGGARVFQILQLEVILEQQTGFTPAAANQVRIEFARRLTQTDMHWLDHLMVELWEPYRANGEESENDVEEESCWRRFSWPAL